MFNYVKPYISIVEVKLNQRINADDFDIPIIAVGLSTIEESD